MTNRANLYDPNGNFAPIEEFDGPNASKARNDPRGGRISNGGFPAGNISGSGPAMHYNRTARYYPNLRNGIGPNRNVGVGGGRPGAFGGGSPNARSGMSSGMGMAGPR